MSKPPDLQFFGASRPCRPTGWLELPLIKTGDVEIQRQQPTSGETVRSFRHANCCQLILPNRFLYGFPNPSQFVASKLTHTHQSRNDPQTPRNHGYTSCSQEMYTRTLTLLQNICVRCVLVMSRDVGGAIYAIFVLVGYIRSVGLQTQLSIDKLRIWSAALAVPHPLPPSNPMHAVTGNPFTIM